MARRLTGLQITGIIAAIIAMLISAGFIIALIIAVFFK